MFRIILCEPPYRLGVGYRRRTPADIFVSPLVGPKTLSVSISELETIMVERGLTYMLVVPEILFDECRRLISGYDLSSGHTKVRLRTRHLNSGVYTKSFKMSTPMYADRNCMDVIYDYAAAEIIIGRPSSDLFRAVRHYVNIRSIEQQSFFQQCLEMGRI